MRNPFVVMALAASAMAASISKSMRAQHLEMGVTAQLPIPHRRPRLTTAAAKRAAIKAKNRAKHRAHCRGGR